MFRSLGNFFFFCLWEFVLCIVKRDLTFILFFYLPRFSQTRVLKLMIYFSLYSLCSEWCIKTWSCGYISEMWYMNYWYFYSISSIELTNIYFTILSFSLLIYILCWTSWYHACLSSANLIKITFMFGNISVFWGSRWYLLLLFTKHFSTMWRVIRIKIPPLSLDRINNQALNYTSCFIKEDWLL